MPRIVKQLRETTKDRVLMWIKHCSDVNFGIWIECVDCKKWRKSYKYSESHEVEENWCCSMNTLENGKKGSCDDPEEDTLEEYLEYSPGSIVWAKLEGYPWWPAMVDVDPDLEEYSWIETNTMFYHVTFLDDHVTRSWIPSKCLSPFSRRPLNSKFQKKYFAAISKAKEKAKTAIKMTLKERLKMFSFVHLYKGKWPLARDFDTYEEENAHNITNTLLEEVEDLDSLNSFDSGMIENNSPSDKEEPKKSPTLFQMKNKVMHSNSSNNDVGKHKYSSSGSTKKLKLSDFRSKVKSKLMKKTPLTKSQPKAQSDMHGDLKVPSNEMLDEVRENVGSTDTDTFRLCGSFKKIEKSEANKKVDVLNNENSKCNNSVSSNDDLYIDKKSENSPDLKSIKESNSNCFDELLKELEPEKIEIPISQDSEINQTNSQDITDLENTSNLVKCIEWVVKSFKITEESQNVEEREPESSIKLKPVKKNKIPNNSFENISSNDDKENISKIPASKNKRKEVQNKDFNEAKQAHTDAGTEKLKISFKPVVPKNKVMKEKTVSKNSLSDKKSKALDKTPDTSNATKRKDPENLSSSNENTSNKKLKPSFQSKVKSNKTSQGKVNKASFKVPVLDTIKPLTTSNIVDKEENVSRSNKVGNDNSDGDSKGQEIRKEDIESPVDDSNKDSSYGLSNSQSEDANVLGIFDNVKNILDVPLSKAKIPNKNKTVQKRENSKENSDFLQNDKKCTEADNKGDVDEDLVLKHNGFSNNLDLSGSEEANILDAIDEDKNILNEPKSIAKIPNIKKTARNSENTEKSYENLQKASFKNGYKTEEDADFSEILVSKSETKSCKNIETVSLVSDSKTNGIESSETNDKDDCFFDILVSDEES